MPTGIWVALIGLGVAIVGWMSMKNDTIIGAATLGFGAAHVVLGILDAAFARSSRRSVKDMFED